MHNEQVEQYESMYPELYVYEPEEELSNCCAAKALGEVVEGLGRCSDCKEFASFIGEERDWYE